MPDAPGPKPPDPWQQSEYKLPQNVRHSPFCPFLSKEEALYHAWVTLCPELSAEKFELLETFLCASDFDLANFRAAIGGTHHRAFMARVEKRLPLLKLESNSVPHTTGKDRGTDREALQNIVINERMVMIARTDTHTAMRTLTRE